MFVSAVAKTTLLLILALIIHLSFLGKVKDAWLNCLLWCTSGANLNVESNSNEGGELQL